MFKRLCNIRIIAFLILSFCLSVIATESGEVIIGSFNIANFGDTNEYERSLINLVNIIIDTKADLLCLQEIEPNDLGKAQAERLLKLLNEAMIYYDQNTYEYVISEQSGDEKTVFFYRSPINLESEIEFLPHDDDPDHDGTPTFQRVPTLGLFSAFGNEFYVVNGHFYTKPIGNTSEGRIEEFRALVNWLKVMNSQNDPKIIVLGDFNRFLGNKTPWKEFFFNNYMQYYRFPLLEAIMNDVQGFNYETEEAPSDQYSTTTSTKLSIYDQIIINRHLYENAKIPVKFGQDVGIVAFDNNNEFEWFIDKWSNATQILSDHRPVWIKLKFDID